MNNKKLALTIAAVVVVIMGIAVYSFSSGDRKIKSESMQKSVVNGIVTERTTTRETTTGNDGSQTRETNTKTTVDPEGLMNKGTTENTTKTEITP